MCHSEMENAPKISLWCANWLLLKVDSVQRRVKLQLGLQMRCVMAFGGVLEEWSHGVLSSAS